MQRNFVKSADKHSKTTLLTPLSIGSESPSVTNENFRGVLTEEKRIELTQEIYLMLDSMQKRNIDTTVVVGQTKVFNKEYLSLSEVAEYTRLAKQTIYQKTSQRIIPHIKKGGKLIFKRTEIDQWLNAGEVLTLTRCAI